MITYKLSRREKALLFALAIVLVVIAWFMLVYQNTTDQITRIEGEISTVDSEIELDTARVARLADMRKVVEMRKAEGATITEVPTYDNMEPLMNELNRIMGAAETYTLTFDEIDRESSAEYVYRGVRINFSCGSYAAAESIIIALANGAFPCVIDSVAIVDNNARPSTSSSSATSVSGYAHVTFFESLAGAPLQSLDDEDEGASPGEDSAAEGDQDEASGPSA